MRQKSFDPVKATILSWLLVIPVAAQVNVLTYHNDFSRSGANLNETILTPANVNTNTFGRLFSYTVDGYVYTQPLYVSGIVVPGQGTHNVIFVATEHNSIYAFDADNNTGPNGGVIWQLSIGNSAVTNSTVWTRYGIYGDIVPEVGITSTPVIDLNSGILFVDVFTEENGSYFHRIHALNITNGFEQPYSPVTVSASVAGGGIDSVGGVVTFNAQQQLQRPALTLAGGVLYVAYSGYADTNPYHGWVLGFDEATLEQLTNYVFNTTPNATTSQFGQNAGEGGIWMGGNGLSVDSSNNLYFETGNGSFSASSGGIDYGDSFIKLSTTNGLSVADYFTPYDQANLASIDADLGSSGPMLLPDSVGSSAHRHLIVGCGKEGKIYLVDRDNMGHYHSGSDSQIVQSFSNLGNPLGTGGVLSSPAFFNNYIYYQPTSGGLTAFNIANGSITTSPASQSSITYGFPGATPSVSANGTSNGIVWVIQADTYKSGGPAILHAYNATNVAQELYNTSQLAARDYPGSAVKTTVPTIANGKVYVGAQFTVSVYGTSSFIAIPTISPNGGVFTNSVTVTLADSTPGTTIYYTLDGTMPDTNSFLYAGPFVLTNSAALQVMAAAPGSVNSGAAFASFINSSQIGNGTGLTAEYHADQTQTFDEPPTLTRVDPTLDFDWTTNGPDPSIGTTNFTVRWTGSVQSQFTEPYTFYTTSEDGIRLWINGQLLIDDWFYQGPTTYSATIPLNAQQLYSIEVDYFQGDGGGVAQLAWSSPSMAYEVVPESQLYPYTNPPPAVVLSAPAEGQSYTEIANVTLSANAAAQYNTISDVALYADDTLLGDLTNSPYIFTATGLAAGSYVLTAVATDGSGVMSTSGPVNITVNPSSGLPYGLTSRDPVPAYLNMPQTIAGALPPLLSQTGVFSDTPDMIPTDGLIPYAPNTPLWSDGALKSRFMALPYNGGLDTPDQQIGFATNGEWTFPSGTIFVKNFFLVTDETDTNTPPRRLETRLLVRNPNGSVYGVTYKWRADNSEADLLSGSLNEDILITNATGVSTQTWYYPSQTDCLACHTPAASYVLGPKTRQLNGYFEYPSTGVTDNQLRSFNQLGLFNPAIDESQITNYSQMVSITNEAATIESRFHSYIDANCSQCHRPGGTGPSFDARYDTPITNANIINASVLGDLGYDNARVIAPDDIWRSILYQRADSLVQNIKMPPLARNLVDSNAMEVVAEWINSLPGIPALPPPALDPDGGTFTGSVLLSMTPSDTNATIYYTLDGSLPTTNSLVYSSPIILTNTYTVNANQFETNYTQSVAASGLFTILPPVYFTSSGGFSNGIFQMELMGTPFENYILEGSTDLLNWVPISTNSPSSTPFFFLDHEASNYPSRFYRAVQTQ